MRGVAEADAVVIAAFVADGRSHVLTPRHR
jgi:hypothetical protein